MVLAECLLPLYSAGNRRNGSTRFRCYGGQKEVSIQELLFGVSTKLPLEIPLNPVLRFVKPTASTQGEGESYLVKLLETYCLIFDEFSQFTVQLLTSQESVQLDQ